MSARTALPTAALLTAAMLAPQPAGAQLLPDTGTTVQVGGLRQQLEELLAPPLAGGAATAPGWTIVPSLAVEQRWTDHLLQPNGTDSAAFITTLTPAVLINGQTARTSTTVSFSPLLQYYSDNGAQNRIDQNFNAISQISLLPDRLFLDLRGFATTQPTGGGYGPPGTVAVARQGETQTMSFSAHPYLRERFGDLGSLELGATLASTSQNGLSYAQQTGTPPPAGTSGGTQNFISQQEYLSAKSGPDLGRTSVAVSITANQSTGSGGINNSTRDEASLTLGYAITRTLTALVSAGYDTLHYGGLPPYNQAGLEWSAGGRWDPNPDSNIIISYGRQYGVESAQVNATYAPTARTRVYARYSEGISTGLEQLLNAMNASTLDPLGNPVGLLNATPLQIANTFYGVQNYLALVTSTSLTAVLLQDRDSFSANLGRQERHQLAAATNTTATGPLDYAGLYGSLSWQHDLRPGLQSTLFAQWGTTTQSGQTGTTTTTGSASQSYNTLVFSLRLSYVLSETISTYAQYSWSSEGGQTLSGVPVNVPTSLVVIGARKTF